MATPATLKKLDDKKMAAQKRHDKLETDQLLPLNAMSNAPSAHLLVSGNPNPAPRMMDIVRPAVGQQKNTSQFTQYRQPSQQQQQMRGMMSTVQPEDFVLDQPQQPQFTPYMSFSAYDQQQRQPTQPQPQQQYQAPMNPQMLANFSQIQIGPMPMKPLSAWNAPAAAPQQQNAMSKMGTGQIRRRPPGAPLPPPKLRPQTVVNAPATVQSVDYVVRANNLVCFHGREHFLSTLYPCNIYIDGHNYPSIEHYYQACKIFQLAGPDQAQLMRAVKDPLQAKSKARDLLRNYGIPNQTVENWKNTHGLIVLLHGLRHKFNQNIDLRDKLMNTGDALLCQAYDRDSMFAVGMNEAEIRQWAKDNEGKVLSLPIDLTEDKVKYLPMMGKGKNVLGVLCMQVRKTIRDKEAKNSNASPEEEKEEESDKEEEDEDKSTQSNEEEEEEGDEEEEEETEEGEEEMKRSKEVDANELIYANDNSVEDKKMSQQINAMMFGIGSCSTVVAMGGNQFGQILPEASGNKENTDDSGTGGQKKKAKKTKKSVGGK